MKQQNSDAISLKIAVLTISDTRTIESDSSGGWLCDAIKRQGHTQVSREIVKDDIYEIRAIISRWIASPDINAIITTGGTGFSGRDSTPEAILPILDKKIDGFGELFRQVSHEEIGTSTIQSRAVAGVAKGTYLFALPGSTGACKDAWDEILHNQLDIRFRPCNFVEIMPRLREHELAGRSS